MKKINKETNVHPILEKRSGLSVSNLERDLGFQSDHGENKKICFAFASRIVNDCSQFA